MMRTLVLAAKDLRILSRDRQALFWVFGFPILFACFIGAVVRAGLEGDTGPLRVVLVDEGQNQESRRVARELARHERIRFEPGTAIEARARVQRAEAVAYLELPKGFDLSNAGATAELGFDPARRMEVAFVEQLLGKVLAGAELATVPRRERLLRREIAPLPRPITASDVVFPSAVCWGLIGCAASFAVSLVTERTSGTYVRLRALGLRATEVLLGKAVSCWVASLGVAGALVLVASFGFGVQVPNPGKMALALGCTAVCFVGITMALSTLGRTEQAVAGAGWATLLVMAMVGGAMVPLSLMPNWLQGPSHASPVKWAIRALEGASWRNLSLLELALPCAVLVGVGLAGFAFGISSLKRSER